MRTRNNYGITLIALIITIVVIFILLGVTVKSILDLKIFNKAIAKTEEETKDRQEEINKIKEGFPDEENENPDACILNIQLKIPVYNASLGEFTVAFGIKAFNGEKVVYENVVGDKISSTNPTPIRVEIPVETGTNVEITPLYSGGSYHISEPAKNITLSKGKVETVSFTDVYDYRINRNASSIISFYNETQYEVK